MLVCRKEAREMKLVTAILALCLVWSGMAWGITFNTPVLDGTILPETWDVESFFDVCVIDSCPYGLVMTWDVDMFYAGLDRDPECPNNRFLGDDPANLSFFVAIDVDQTFGSGAPQDGYGNVNFFGCYMPEYIYYYAGGVGWYEWGYWTGTEWEWRGWRSDNTFYGWVEAVDDEVGMLWSDLGFPVGIAVMAWITDETTFGGAEPGVLCTWPPQNPTGTSPTFMWAYPFFVPHVPGPMPVAGFGPNWVAPDNGEATATDNTSWGAIKALYR
jgi:hypothetical protein